MKLLSITNHVFAETERFLRRRGQSGKEGLVLWVGQRNNIDRAYVLVAIKAGDSWPDGVRLGFRQMVKLTEFLASHNLVLLAQVHNHPDNIPHSLGDNNNPASFEAGYISIVVPDMGLRGIDIPKCFIYEYQSRLRWREFTEEEKTEQFKILPKGLRL